MPRTVQQTPFAIPTPPRFLNQQNSVTDILVAPNLATSHSKKMTTKEFPAL
jgi:hypothetical protein